MKSIGSFFKNFVVFNHNIDTSLIVEDEDNRPEELSDPNPSAWSTKGLVPVIEGEDYFHQLDGMGFVFCVQFNERILPGKVRDEHVKKRAERIQEGTGRKPSKKEYRELRDEVELELLPKAFIRRSKVFGLITASRLVIFSSSTKRQDDVMLVLFGNLDLYFGAAKELSFTRPSLKDGLSGLTGLALGDDERFAATKNALLVNAREEAETPTIRIKDKNVYSSDVQALLKQGYRAHELGLSTSAGTSFTLTKSMTVKRFSIGDDVVLSHFNESVEDFHGAAWLACRTALDVWTDIEVSFEDDEL